LVYAATFENKNKRKRSPSPQQDASPNTDTIDESNVYIINKTFIINDVQMGEKPPPAIKDSRDLVSDENQQQGNQKKIKRSSACTICESPTSQYVLKFPCRHLFCKPCLAERAPTLNTCIMCKETFSYPSIKRVHLGLL